MYSTSMGSIGVLFPFETKEVCFYLLSILLLILCERILISSFILRCILECRFSHYVGETISCLDHSSGRSEQL